MGTFSVSSMPAPGASAKLRGAAGAWFTCFTCQKGGSGKEPGQGGGVAIAGLCLEGFLHYRMDYPTPRLMGSHFAKHLSPLVPESEHEMGFGSVVALAVFRLVSGSPVRACSTWVAPGDSHRAWGGWGPAQGTGGCSCHLQQPGQGSSGHLCRRHLSRLDVGGCLLDSRNPTTHASHTLSTVNSALATAP